ncbi:type I-C CRISPR-associated protein Cas8c/Csd1 [Dehalococcoidia bacterium]|nr:type I-C CRISPR-associated protein Cas8c/Csd1 [Dehalococcoidia bacterium]
MLLQKLAEYAERRDLPPIGYKRGQVSWVIDLDMSGQLLSNPPIYLGDESKRRTIPDVGNRTSNIVANLLTDTAEYALGMPRDARTSQRHQAFVELVKRCAESTKEPSVGAVERFLQGFQWGMLQMPKDREMRPEEVVAFCIDGIHPVDRDEVQEFWADEFWARVMKEKEDQEIDERELSGAAPKEMQCLICGKVAAPVPRHPFKIPGIPGGKAKGNALVSANFPAAYSYGQSESRISPCCKKCVEAYSQAAIDLVRDDDTSIRMGPFRYIFWTREECPFSPALMLRDPKPEEVKELMTSVFKGRDTATQIDANRFYATAFSASGGRVAVRDWVDTTVDDAQRSLARYFILQNIVDEHGGEGRPLPLDKLADATIPERNSKPDRKQLNPNVCQVLMRLAFEQGPLPMWLLFQAVKRNRAEQGITYPRAALIKMVLLSQQSNIEEDFMVKLDPENRHPAYLCGRLLAVLESIQKEAAKPRQTIVDRFYGTASSAPASVFGHLLRGAQAHLGKLRKEKRGYYIALGKKLEEVQSGLSTFPKTLTLQQQGLFSLGYWHQRAADRAGAIDKQSQQDEDQEAIEKESKEGT